MSVHMSQMGVSPPRLELPQPIAATLVDMDAQIVEVSLVGCAVHHPARIKVGSTVNLQFVWNGKRVRLDAKVARSTMQFADGKPGYVSGLQFAESVETAPAVVREIVASLVPPPPSEPEPVAPVAAPPAPQPKPKPKPQAQPKAKPSTPPPLYETVPFLRMQEDFDELEPETADPLFLRCRFIEGKWQNERVADGAQPDDDGFTIPAETEDVDALCRTYEVADPETRRMMRFSFEIANGQQRRA